MSPKNKKNGLRRHSLSIVCAAILLLWIVLYRRFDPSTHLGSFFGNAIADWSGVLLTVLATKYLYEVGSAESRRPPKDAFLAPLRMILIRHSLSIFLIVTGIGWVILFAHMSPTARWGQVVGNIVSEWTQVFGMVILTKKLVEFHSKETHRN